MALPLKSGLTSRLTRLGRAVNEEVQLGFHLCYGDSGHKHFVQPTDTGLSVEIAMGFSMLSSGP